MPDFVKIGTKGDMPEEGEMKIFDVEGEQVAVARVKGKLHAFANTCTHQGGPLGEGALNEAVVTCPWHHVQFDVTTGKIINIPFDTGKYGNAKDIETFEIKEEGSNVLVSLG